MRRGERLQGAGRRALLARREVGVEVEVERWRVEVESRREEGERRSQEESRESQLASRWIGGCPAACGRVAGITVKVRQRQPVYL